MKRKKCIGSRYNRITVRAALLSAAVTVATPSFVPWCVGADTQIGWNNSGHADNNWANPANWLIDGQPAGAYPNDVNGGVDYAVTVSSGGQPQISAAITIDTLLLQSDNGGASTALLTGGSLTAATLTMNGTDAARLSISGGAAVTIGTAVIGNQNGGTANVSQTGGTATFGTLIIDLAIGQHGTYDLQGGTLISKAREIVTGTVNQSGSSNNSLSQELYVGGIVATYNLSGGSLAVPSLEVIGAGERTGVFNQTGGLNFTDGGTNGTLVLGEKSLGGVSAQGTYNLSAGTLGVGTVSLGGDPGAPAGTDGGTGTFTQSGGQANIAQDLLVGTLPQGQGTFTLNDGSLTSGASERVGINGIGNFTQNGGSNVLGTVTSPASMYIGQNATTGNYFLQGGTLTINGDLWLSPDWGGYGGFAQSQISGSSTAQISGTLYIAPLGGTGDYTLVAGNLTAGNVDIENGVFKQLGGSSTVVGNLAISNASTYDLLGGVLTAPAAQLNSAQLNVGAGGSVQQLLQITGDSAGTLSVAAGGYVGFGAGNKAIDSVDVENSGTIAVTGPGDIAFGATVNNNAGGVFDIQIDSGMLGAGSGTFNNSGGTLQKSGGTGTSTFSGLALTNSSTIDGQSGTLDLNVTGTNSGAINSQAGATVKLGGTWALNAGSSFNGAGTTVAYGTLNVMGNVTAATDFQLASGGVLQGSGYTFTSTNLLELQDGSSMSSPSSSTPLTVTSTGSMNVTGSPSLTTVVLNANGPTNQTGGANPYPALAAYSNTIINNNSTWTVADDSGISGDSTSVLNNNGNFLKTGGGGTSAVQIPFNNAGTVNVESGTMDLKGGGSGGGTFYTATNLQMEGNWSLAGAQFTGPGVVVANGTISGNASTSGYDFMLGSSGVIQSGGNITVNSPGRFDWYGVVNGTLGSDAGSTVNVFGYGALLGGTFGNAGTTVFGAMTVAGATITSSGTFVVSDGATVDGDSSGNVQFFNYGLLGGGGGVGSSAAINGLFIENSKTINSGTATFTLDAGHNLGGGVLSSSAGGALVLGGPWTFEGGTQFTGSGIVTTANGNSYTVNGNIGSTGNFTLAAGTTLTGAGSFQNYGQFSWSGTMAAGVSLQNFGGVITIVGSSPVLAGSLVNGAMGTLVFPAYNSFLSVPGGTITNYGQTILAADGGMGASYPPTGNAFYN